jgi:hypothetical protein
MDGGTSDVELLLASTKQEIKALRDDPRFKKPAEGKRGAGLYEHVVDLLDASGLRMKTPPEPEASPAAREAFARNLREAISVLREAHHAIPWLAATRAPNVNLGSLYMSEEFTELLVGNEADLVFVPGRGFMYSTLSWPFSPTIQSTPGFTPKTKRRPIIVNYPLSDSDRLLLHPLFAHEIGHSTVYEFHLIQKFNNEVLSDEALTHRLTEEANWVVANVAPGQSELKMLLLLREWLRNWVTELLCDLLAVEASGPAYVWAVAAFGLPMNRSEPSETHPPTTLRIRLILELLAGNGWSQFSENAAPGIAAVLSEVAKDASSELPRPWELLRKVILDNAQWLRDVASEQVGAGALKPNVVAGEADQASQLLSQLILPVGPNEKPLAPRAIVLGGWLDGFRRHGDNVSGLLKAQADRRLQNLVGKAIEMSTVAASWSKP